MRRPGSSSAVVIGIPPVGATLVIGLQLISAVWAPIKLRLRAMRRRFTTPVAALLAAVTLAACGGSSKGTSSQTASSSPGATSTARSTPHAARPTASTASGSPTGLSFEGIPLEVGPFIAPADTTQTAPVDGIKCGRIEQLA